MQTSPHAAVSTGDLTTSLNDELSRVDAHVDGTLVGFSAYEVCSDGTWSFHHTETFEEYSGKGYGKQLAAGVMDVAREQGIKIAPTCPFLRKYMDQHPETQELRAD
jgi:predicted GNAT family acetyltransferase